MKKLLILAATLAATITLTGCVNGQHLSTTDGHCLTCINNPLTGKPLNYDPNEHENSGIGNNKGASGSQSLSTHAHFRVQAVKYVFDGIDVEERPYFEWAPNDPSRVQGTYLIMYGHSVRSPLETANLLKQGFNFSSHADLKRQGKSPEQIAAIMKEKPYFEDSSKRIYRMGGTFSTPRGPITAVIIAYGQKNPKAIASFFGVKVIGYDSYFTSTEQAATTLHTQVINALNYNKLR